MTTYHNKILMLICNKLREEIEQMAIEELVDYCYQLRAAQLQEKSSAELQRIVNAMKEEEQCEQ